MTMEKIAESVLRKDVFCHDMLLPDRSDFVVCGHSTGIQPNSCMGVNVLTVRYKYSRIMHF